MKKNIKTAIKIGIASIVYLATPIDYTKFQTLWALACDYAVMSFVVDFAVQFATDFVINKKSDEYVEVVNGKRYKVHMPKRRVI